MYQYVPSTYWYILMLYHICLHFEGYIPVHTDFFSVCTFDFRILLRPPPPGPAGLPASDLCTCTSFEPHHTKASSSSFTAACRHPWRRRARRSAPPLAALAGPLQRPPPPLVAAGLLHQTPPGAAGLLQGPGPLLPQRYQPQAVSTANGRVKDLGLDSR